MILIDSSQLVIASALNESGYSPRNSDQDNSNLIKHIFFNTVRSYNRLYRRKYGELVFAVDSRNYWRKEIFEHYKYKRKKKREDSDINWDLIHQIKKELLADVDKYFPYPVIESDGAEADDVLAVLSRWSTVPHLIVASDHDMGQLCVNFVEQYCPRKKQILKHTGDINDLILDHIINGDTGDGVCNIRSPNDSFVTGTRQKPITKKFREECHTIGIPVECLDRYIENKQLVDLSMIPEKIVADIEYKWEHRVRKDASEVFNYLAKNGYRLLLQDIGDF
jgi:hypothetical protein